MLRADPRTDRVAFAARVLGVEPFDHQVVPLRSSAAVIAGAGGRRSGKTLAAQIAALHTAFVHRDCKVLVTSANTASARRFIEETADLLRASKIAGEAVVDAEAMLLTFRNGSQIRGLPPTAGQLRGYGRGVRMVVIDEAGLCPEGTWRDARYVLLDLHAEGAQAWLIGSPWGDGFFREAWQRGRDGDSDYLSFTWPTSLNPGVPVDFIARERGRLNSREAAAELDGVWSSAGDAFFSRELLDSCVADVELSTLASLPGRARFLLGCDWGVSYDRSAAVTIGRLPVWQMNPEMAGRPVFGIPSVDIWPQGAQLRRVWEDVASSPGLWGVVTSETNGVGAACSQELRGRLAERAEVLRERGAADRDYLHSWNAHATSAQSKATGYGHLLTLLEQGRLVLPRDPDLLRQLAGLRYEQGQRGSVRIEAESAAVHDDVCDALLLATGPHTRNGRQANALAMAGQSSHFDATVPLDVETVSTPGGVVVPRRPQWQSPRGMELSPVSVPAPAHAPVVPDLIARARIAVAQALAEPNERNGGVPPFAWTGFG